MNKLLSIIIPTRNRQVYCVESIKSIITDIDDRCEIVIQDNSSDSSLKDMISELNANNIVYNYNSDPLSFIDNFEEALNLSTGEYFIILGDDDSTTKDIVPIVEWMKKNGIESLSSSFVVDYIWKNDKIEKYKNGYLTIPKYTGEIKDVNVQEGLQGLLKNGFLAYQLFDLPRTYHGIVKRTCMDEIKKRAGRYFGGLTPDMYSTIALACVIKNHKIIDYPFSIAGACPASATVNATQGGHSGKYEDAPHLNNRGPYEWESIVPKYYSVETIWAETGIKALKDMRYPDWEKKFNKYKLYLYGIFINRKYILKLSIKETLNMYKRLNIGVVSHIYNIIKVFIVTVLEKFFKTKKITPNKERRDYNSVLSLQDSKEVLYQNVENIKFNINE